MENKICPHCGAEFMPTGHAQQFCSINCRKGNTRARKRETAKTYNCSWCGVAFQTNFKRKYCSEECRKRSEGRFKKYNKQNKKAVKSIEEICELARKENLSYGQYCAKYGLY